MQRLTWFFAGCIAGGVGLYVFLFESGVLTPYLQQVRSANQTHVAGPLIPPAADEQARPLTPGGTANGEPQFPSADNLVLPIQGITLTNLRDTFNDERGGGRLHEAIDIMADRNTPIRAMVDGRIERLFLSKPGGNTIYQFDEQREFCYYYAHLDHYAEGIREGLEVARGTIIGYVGNTGDAVNGPTHLHLAVFRLGPKKEWWKGTAVNPFPLLLNVMQRLQVPVQ